MTKPTPPPRRNGVAILRQDRQYPRPCKTHANPHPPARYKVFENPDDKVWALKLRTAKQQGHEQYRAVLVKWLAHGRDWQTTINLTYHGGFQNDDLTVELLRADLDKLVRMVNKKLFAGSDKHRINVIATAEYSPAGRLHIHGTVEKLSEGDKVHQKYREQPFRIMAAMADYWCLTMKRGHPDGVDFAPVRDDGWLDYILKKIDSHNTDQILVDNFQ